MNDCFIVFETNVRCPQMKNLGLNQDRQIAALKSDFNAIHKLAEIGRIHS